MLRAANTGVSAVIDAVGVDAGPFKVGQRIAVSPSRPCGACRYCHQGLPNHCLNMRFYGSAMPFPHIQGAFRQSLVIETHQAHVLADRGPERVSPFCVPMMIPNMATGLAAIALGARGPSSAVAIPTAAATEMRAAHSVAGPGWLATARQLRDTATPTFAIQDSVPSDEVKVRLDPSRLFGRS